MISKRQKQRLWRESKARARSKLHAANCVGVETHFAKTFHALLKTLAVKSKLTIKALVEKLAKVGYNALQHNRPDKSVYKSPKSLPSSQSKITTANLLLEQFRDQQAVLVSLYEENIKLRRLRYYYLSAVKGGAYERKKRRSPISISTFIRTGDAVAIKLSHNSSDDAAERYRQKQSGYILLLRKENKTLTAEIRACNPQWTSPIDQGGMS